MCLCLRPASETNALCVCVCVCVRACVGGCARARACVRACVCVCVCVTLLSDMANERTIREQTDMLTFYDK